jgi:hypothetical protein
VFSPVVEVLHSFDQVRARVIGEAAKAKRYLYIALIHNVATSAYWAGPFESVACDKIDQRLQ